MTKKNQIYKCEICGNVVGVVEAGKGELVCCNQPMKLVVEKTSEKEGKEKHVPVMEKTEKGVRVSVGSIPHPMEDKHYIEQIEILRDGLVIFSKVLQPGQKPVAEFCVDNFDGLRARAYCNVHGLWIN